MPFELPQLPYDYDALEPHMSADTLRFHHDKHHKKYIDTLNELISGTQYERRPLEEIVQESARHTDQRKIFNNAGQSWNHTFFWNCMSPDGGGAPEGELAQRIEAAFGGLDGFKQKFKQAAVGQFGSGWAWLVVQDDELKVMPTPNAETPVMEGIIPLLTCDVWEHAYYLDYQNRRPDFVQAFLDNLVNWEFAAQQLAGETSFGREREAEARRASGS